MVASILDNDLYKFTMQNAVIKLYPCSKVKYKFINRNSNNFPKDFYKKLRELVNEMSELSLTEAEEEFLRKKFYFFDPFYIDFLKGYRYNPDEVKITQQGGKLNVEIEGYWYRSILWEVPLLALISELYFDITRKEKPDYNKIKKINITKAEKFEQLGAKFADFGTRRRYSFENHENVVKVFKEYAPKTLIGTSNVHLAHKYQLTPIGTQAHEWFMFHAVKYGYKMANSIALGRWVDVYHGNLGIALSDTFTSEAFFEVFDTMYAKLFDGVRQDSGNPIDFANDLIKHYKNLRIDPGLKTIVFSDSLNYRKVKRIETKLKNKINTSYGIGTNLSNDIPGVKPLNIVIKMIEAAPYGNDWASTIKLSDVKGKHTGNKKSIALAKRVLGIRN
ncbi:MAG: nicotinate phosphoribosyltransferase [Ignavibacteriae bacterium]|nr:MAG: nicotinate phosphoribosyltransferase [Ignavibacteriota bacterium]